MPFETFTRIGKVIRVKNKKATNFTNENDTYLTVLVKINGEVKPLMFTDIEFLKAEVRGQKNKEDQVKQSWISKILD
jgi:hypothetical protein